MNLCLLDKYPHWSEVLSVLRYSDSSIPFVSHKRVKESELYVDPLGNLHDNYMTTTEASKLFKEPVLVVNGSIHLETHPLNRGKIPYKSLPVKLAIEHTTGYSPWDYLQMVDLVEISMKRGEDSQGSTVLFAMNKKFHDRFMKTDWKSFNKDYYESYKDKIKLLTDKGYIKVESFEPAQLWLEKVGETNQQVFSDRICLCLNWCNLNRKYKVDKLITICKELHNYTGLDIDIRLHSYTSSFFLSYFDNLDYVHLILYKEMSKYEIMDSYNIYFVDGTGLGYEIAYRNYFKNRPVDIFYLEGLNSDLPHEGFDGIVEMGAVPQYSYKDFIRGESHSYFDPEVVRESFPHRQSHVIHELSAMMSRLANDAIMLHKEGHND